MGRRTTLYKRRRLHAEITQHAVWLYYSFNLSRRDIEDLLARDRGGPRNIVTDKLGRHLLAAHQYRTTPTSDGAAG